MYVFYVYFTPCFASSFFFLNHTATTEIYTLSLHDALPIFRRNGIRVAVVHVDPQQLAEQRVGVLRTVLRDRKSTRLNSSHTVISYAVFCLKKKKSNQQCETTYNMDDVYANADHIVTKDQLA